MLVTLTNARQIIRAHYGNNFKFHITINTTIGVRPLYQNQIGFPTLCWAKIDQGKNSAVRIGQLISIDDKIDWNWENAKAFKESAHA